jgi:hypothetical protein
MRCNVTHTEAGQRRRLCKPQRCARKVHVVNVRNFYPNKIEFICLILSAFALAIRLTRKPS